MKKHIGKVLISLMLAVILTVPVFCLAASMDLECVQRAAIQISLCFSLPVAVAAGDILYCAEYLYKNRGTKSSVQKKLNTVSLCLSAAAVITAIYLLFESPSFFTYLPLIWMLSYPVFRLVYAKTIKYMYKS